MQRALTVVFVALVVGAPAAAAEARLRFSVPGSFAAATSSTWDGEWAVLVFEDTPSSVSFRFASAGQVENRTWVQAVRLYNHSQEVNFGDDVQSFGDVPAKASFTVASPAMGKSSIYIEANHIRFDTAATTGRLAEKPDGMGLNPLMREQEKADKTHRQGEIAGDHAVLVYEPDGSTSFVLAAEGARHVEWHGAQVQCEGSDWCPDGGTTTTTQVPLPMTDFNVSSDQFTYQIATGGLGPVHGKGSFVYAILGGRQLGFSLDDGRLRLPLASLDGSCEGCILPDNQTLTAGGDLALTAMQRVSDNKLEASLGGSVTEARFDEQYVDPGLLLGPQAKVAVEVVAVATLSLLAFRLLGFLFTKWTDRDVLNNPLRRLIHEAILRHPGIGFRELTRTTGVAYTTMRHHIDVLLRHGMIVEKRQGTGLKLFENHGKFDKTWSRIAILRDHMTREVHDWLSEHPGVSQQDVVTAMLERGLSRAAAQRRLNRLVTAGLATVQRQGRLNVYRVMKT